MDNEKAQATLTADQEQNRDNNFISQRHADKVDGQYMRMVHQLAAAESVAELQARKLSDLRAQIDGKDSQIADLTATIADLQAKLSAPAEDKPAAPAEPSVFSSNRVIQSTPN